MSNILEDDLKKSAAIEGNVIADISKSIRSEDFVVMDDLEELMDEMETMEIPETKEMEESQRRYDEIIQKHQEGIS